MTCRHWIRSGLLTSGALMALGAMTLRAQSVESIMGARERLELTDQQIQQLDAIRREAVAERNADMARIAELRSQLQAGQIRRSDLMAEMEDQQDARRARVEERNASVDAILTEAQREQVQQMRRRGARERVGRRPQRGPAARPGFGVGPGARPGFAPGRGPGFGPGDRGFRPGNGQGLGPSGAPEPPPDDTPIGPR